MATLVLQTVGTAVGGFLFGPLGAIAGRALGALGGSVIDQSLFGEGDRLVEGPRLDNTQFLSSREGASIPRIFGRSRIAGEVIWATRLKEVQRTQKQSQGGKGSSGPKTVVKTYSYFANFAVGLCEGEIAGIRRIWADGKELDQGDFNLRTYRGSPDQLPDALIESKQGEGNAPAYRGLAYVVFEDFPLENFGNRIPQVSIEVLKPLGEIENHIYGVNLIPGATEFGYDTAQVVEKQNRVEFRKLNKHQNIADTDFLASLDELMMLCPNLKQVALVIAWFGDDLRAEHCKLQPKVEVGQRNIHRGNRWRVAGIQRSQAQHVSKTNGVLSYGGSPSDQTVIRAIQELKQRGLKVCLNPFIMMDIPDSNELPDPYGAERQNAFPWRGRITCFPAVGELETVDQTAAASQQIDTFLGQIQISDVMWENALATNGALNRWSYRHMIFHYARIAEHAGGVDMFLIGSEMVGLTKVRGLGNSFPFVEGLISIANDVKSVLGENCIVTYAADWSEYFGYHPQDGSNDLFFNLDPLWSHPSIDVVAIDNYMPVSDWRDVNFDQEEGFSSTDVAMLKRQISSGEVYDWYYETEGDRQTKTRTLITDGLGKPWVFKFKDLKSWWNNHHYNRISGSEVATPTNWSPQSKPFVFNEFGAPAIHNGAAQPNVFYDPKSSESAVPHFSNGGRSDDAMLSYIKAQQLYWDDSSPGFEDENNSTSSVYSGRMVDFQASQLWAWDARPFPTFPKAKTVWSDGENWQRGHWLNGRLGSVRIAELLQTLLHTIGISDANTDQVDGTIDGFVIGNPSSLRSEIEALLEFFQISVSEHRGILTFRSKGVFEIEQLSQSSFVEIDSRPIVSKTTTPRSELTDRALLEHVDPSAEFQPAQLKVEKANSQNQRQVSLALPVVSDGFVLQPVLDDWLNAKWASRTSITFSLPLSFCYLNVGDHFRISEADKLQIWQITSVEQGLFLTIDAKAVEFGNRAPVEVPNQIERFNTANFDPTVVAVFLDLPPVELLSLTSSNFVAVASQPWIRSAAVYVSPTTDNYVLRQVVEQQAFIGELTSTLLGSIAVSRWNWRDTLRVKLSTGQLFSANKSQVLSGSNAIAVRSTNSAWEIIQFQNAALVGEQEWELTGLLRGQSGTESEAQIGSLAGADVVVLNEAVEPILGAENQKGDILNWAIGSADKSIGDPSIVKQQAKIGQRGDVPFKPVHLKATRDGGGALQLNWIRRGRVKSDSWVPLEIPLGEETEHYVVHLRDQSDKEIKLETNTQSLSVSAIQLQDLFGSLPSSLDVSVAQFSTTVGAGSFAETSIQFNQ